MQRTKTVFVFWGAQTSWIWRLFRFAPCSGGDSRGYDKTLLFDVSWFGNVMVCSSTNLLLLVLMGRLRTPFAFVTAALWVWKQILIFILRLSCVALLPLFMPEEIFTIKWHEEHLINTSLILKCEVDHWSISTTIKIQYFFPKLFIIINVWIMFQDNVLTHICTNCSDPSEETIRHLSIRFINFPKSFPSPTCVSITRLTQS